MSTLMLHQNLTLLSYARLFVSGSTALCGGMRRAFDQLLLLLRKRLRPLSSSSLRYKEFSTFVTFRVSKYCDFQLEIKNKKSVIS